MAKKVLIFVCCFVLFLCPLVSADVVRRDVVIYKSSTPNFAGNCGLYVGGVPTDVRTSAYYYGGTYDPLIVINEKASVWSTALVNVLYRFDHQIKAGTSLDIRAIGWRNHSYVPTSSRMIVSTVPFSNSTDYFGNAGQLSLDGLGDVSTSNGVYHGSSFSGSYTLQSDADYLWLAYEVTVPQRNGGCYLGLSLSGVSYTVDTDTEANANDKGGGAVDTVMEAINLNVDVYGGALNSLVSAVSYSGTDAVLPIPAIKIPAFDATGGEIELLSSQSYDFSEAINMVPASILLLVRSLLTAALIWFSVKELVGFIQYFLTLRGGGVDE